MKVTSNPTLHATLLLTILLFYACSLVKDVGSLRQGRALLASKQTREVAFRDPMGIGVDGKPFDAASQDAKKYLGFLVRDRSLQDDVTFWSQVNALLGPNAAIKVVGYCDGQSCAESIRRLQRPPFPVLAYAEAVTAQALADADAKGLAILKVAGKAGSSVISWRGEGNTPRQAVEASLR